MKVNTVIGHEMLNDVYTTKSLVIKVSAVMSVITKHITVIMGLKPRAAI